MNRLRLGVNIDHIATIPNRRSVASDDNVAMRRLIIFVSGEIAVLAFGYGMSAILSIPIAVSGIAGSALAVTAAFSWPRYRFVTYLGLGLIALLTAIAVAFSIFLIVACLHGECV
jgi:hypothetical protein